MVIDIIDRHKENKNIISVLQSIQTKFGYIPEKETADIAKKLDIPLAKLWGVATFYSQFKLHKEGKYLIQVCNGTACHVNNSQELIDFLFEKLDLDENKLTTDDNLFTIELVNCIGACARAPAILVNETVYGNLDTKELERIIEKYKNE